MTSLILKLLKDNTRKLIANIIIALLFVWIYVGFYPSIEDEAEQFEEALSIYPEEFLRAFDISEDFFLSFEAFLGGEYFSILWPIVMFVFVISLAGGLFAKEIEKGTIDVLLSMPISRAKLFIAKYIGGTVVLTIFALLSIGLLIPSAAIVDIELSNKSVGLIFVLSWLFMMALYSLGIMISSIVSSPGKVTIPLSTGLVLMYGAKIVATFQESVDWAKYLSFFYYYDYNAALLDHEIDQVSFTVFIGTIIISTLLGFFYFQKRDIAA